MSDMNRVGAGGASTSTATKQGQAEQETAKAERQPRTPERRSALQTDRGKTAIADTVVAKIAGLAAREIPGVHSLGTGLSRAIGSLRTRVGQEAMTQGVAVEVGERQAAVDLDLVTFYGQSIVSVSDAVRANVANRIESMTGLEVTEVNITVDDLFVEGEESDQDGAQQETRVK